jgi:hypothetical protein
MRSDLGSIGSKDSKSRDDFDSLLRDIEEDDQLIQGLIVRIDKALNSLEVGSKPPTPVLTARQLIKLLYPRQRRRRGRLRQVRNTFSTLLYPR